MFPADKNYFLRQQWLYYLIGKGPALKRPLPYLRVIPFYAAPCVLQILYKSISQIYGAGVIAGKIQSVVVFVIIADGLFKLIREFCSVSATVAIRTGPTEYGRDFPIPITRKREMFLLINHFHIIFNRLENDVNLHSAPPAFGSLHHQRKCYSGMNMQRKNYAN